MKSFRVIIVIILIFFLNSIAQEKESSTVTTTRLSDNQSSNADELAITDIAQKWMSFYNQGIAAQVAALYTEAGYYLSAHILAHGRDAIQAYWERGIAAGGHIDFIRPLTVYHSGELGYYAGTYQATNAGVTVDGRILIVAKKINDNWFIAAHETVVRDQP